MRVGCAVPGRNSVDGKMLGVQEQMRMAMTHFSPEAQREPADDPSTNHQPCASVISVMHQNLCSDLS
jgi:hypothetical protein